jgi:hypothetical protein
MATRYFRRNIDATKERNPFLVTELVRWIHCLGRSVTHRVTSDATIPESHTPWTTVKVSLSVLYCVEHRRVEYRHRKRQRTDSTAHHGSWPSGGSIDLVFSSIQFPMEVSAALPPGKSSLAQNRGMWERTIIPVTPTQYLRARAYARTHTHKG